MLAIHGPDLSQYSGVEGSSLRVDQQQISLGLFGVRIARIPDLSPEKLGAQQLAVMQNSTASPRMSAFPLPLRSLQYGRSAPPGMQSTRHPCCQPPWSSSSACSCLTCQSKKDCLTIAHLEGCVAFGGRLLVLSVLAKPQYATSSLPVPGITLAGEQRRSSPSLR